MVGIWPSEMVLSPKFTTPQKTGDLWAWIHNQYARGRRNKGLRLDSTGTLQAYLSALEIFWRVCLSSCTPSPGHREPSLESGPSVSQCSPQPSLLPELPCPGALSVPGLHPCRLLSWPGNRQSNSRTTSAPSSQDPPTRLQDPGQRTGHI